MVYWEHGEEFKPIPLLSYLRNVLCSSRTSANSLSWCLPTPSVISQLIHCLLPSTMDRSITSEFRYLACAQSTCLPAGAVYNVLEKRSNWSRLNFCMQATALPWQIAGNQFLRTRWGSTGTRGLIPQLVLLTTRLSLRLISSLSSPPCAAKHDSFVHARFWRWCHWQIYWSNTAGRKTFAY